MKLKLFFSLSALLFLLFACSNAQNSNTISLHRGEIFIQGQVAVKAQLSNTNATETLVVVEESTPVSSN